MEDTNKQFELIEIEEQINPDVKNTHIFEINVLTGEINLSVNLQGIINFKLNNKIKKIYRSNVSFNMIKGFENLPESLEYIDFTNTRVINFGNLHLTNGKNLKKVKCNKNNSFKLETLPNSVEELYFINTDKEYFPNLPLNLKKLYCYHNKLLDLSNLPPNLEILNCSFNKLTSLDNLPNGLIKLCCTDNEIQTLNNLPDSLQVLSCSFNKINILDKLPNNLSILECMGNDLIKIDIPSKLEYLDCSNNNLDFIGNIPNALRNLFCADNSIKLEEKIVYPDFITRLRK